MTRVRWVSGRGCYVNVDVRVVQRTRGFEISWIKYTFKHLLLAIDKSSNFAIYNKRIQMDYHNDVGCCGGSDR